ncbi:oligosaccharide flippase family protein [soil metagenome]
MLQDIKYTLRHSAVYGISRIATKALAFVFVPLYTTVYSLGSIANINLLETFWQILLTICLFGFETSIITFCSPEKKENRKPLFFYFTLILLINCSIFFIIPMMFRSSIAGMVVHNAQYSNVIFLCFLICIFETLLVLPLSAARLNNSPKLYTGIALSSLMINFVLQLIFILGLKKDFEWIFVAKFIGPMAVFILTIPYLIKQIKVQFDIEVIKKIIAFSFIFTLAAISAMLLNTADRFILDLYQPKDTVAIYTVGYSVGSIINSLVLMPFNLALVGIFWKKAEEDNSERYFTKTTTYLFFTMILVSLIVSFYIPSGIKLFARNPHLWPAVNVIRIILFANCIGSLYYVSALSFLYRKNSSVLLIVTSAAMVFNIIGNFIFIKYYGMYACAVLSVLSFLVQVVLSYNIAKKYYYIRFEVYKMVLLSALYILFSLIVTWYPLQNLLMDSFLKLGYIVIFFILLYIFRFFEPIEIQSIKGFFNKYLKFGLK